MSAEQPAEGKINEDKQVENRNEVPGNSATAVVPSAEASNIASQTLEDIAIPGPSNAEPKSLLGQSSSSSTDQKSRKRERCDDDTSNSEEDKKTENIEAPVQDRPNENETCPFPRLRIRTRHRRYRRRLNDRSSSSSSSDSSSSSSKNSLSSSDDGKLYFKSVCIY